MPLYFAYTARSFSVMFLGDAYAWATPSTLATLSLGDAFFLGDTFFLATPSSWRRFLSWRRLLLGDACRRFERKKDKD